eukprot:gene1676-3241_t
MKSKSLLKLFRSCKSLGNRKITTNEHPSFAMSGCGWLTPFHFGSMHSFREHGFITDETKFAGTSGGALGALLACSNVDSKKGLETLISLSQNRNFKSNINMGLKDVMRELLPEDAVSRCNNRLFITVTRAWPQPKIAPIIISTFESNDDMLDAVCTSCFIPLYSSRQIFSPFRRGMYVDGGVFAFMPPIGDITITPFPSKYLLRTRRKPEVSPSLSPSFKYSIAQLITWVLHPAPPAILRDLFEEGRRASDIWIERRINCIERGIETNSSHDKNLLQSHSRSHSHLTSVDLNDVSHPRFSILELILDVVVDFISDAKLSLSLTKAFEDSSLFFLSAANQPVFEECSSIAFISIQAMHQARVLRQRQSST